MSPNSIGCQTATFIHVSTRKLQAMAAVSMLTFAALGGAERAAAGTTFTGQFGTGNTWNLYEAINTPMTFKEALAFAPTRPDPTGGSVVGHLVTISNLAENQHVYTTAGSADRWLGLSDRVGVAPGASESQVKFNNLLEGWAWVTGEPFTFENWERDDLGIPTEPNNAGGVEDAAHMWGGGFWNDNQSGFGADEPTPDNITFDSPAEAPVTMGFIIEWDTNLASQPPGFPGTRPDPILPGVFPDLPTRMTGPNGTASAFGVLEVRDQGGSGNTRNAIAKIQSGGGTRFEGTAAYIDLWDPDSGDNQGSVAEPPPRLPFISDNPGVDDNDIQSVIKGTVQVPAGQGGLYTFNVRSDDGFGLRILSQATGGPVRQHRFTASNNGFVDEDGSLVFMNPTGDSNTQGVVDLAPGTYDVEFAVFEDGGGAFWEVSTAKGDFVTSFGGLPRWLHLGDGTTLPPAGPFPQAARLTGNATVRNYGFQDNITNVVFNFRANPAPDAQSMVEDVVLFDGDDICCGRPGSFVADMRSEFPNGGNDMFSTAVTGQFQVLDTNGTAGETLTFGLFADDNAALHIIGQSFTNVVDFTGDGTAMLTNPEGGADQWMVADYRTGNTNAFGLITLAEGTYNFEAFELEDGGDSGLEVWVAAGDRLANGLNSGAFFPLTTATLSPIFAGNSGLDLVAGPGTGPVSGPIPGDYNGDGKVDAADYVVWRKTDGTPGGYNTWRTNFGRTSGSGAGAAAGVPEPATGLLLMVLAGCAACYRGLRAK